MIENNVPFAIRLKEDMQLRLEDGILREFRSLLRKHKSGSWQGWLKGMEPTSENRLHVSAKRIKKGELFIVVTDLENAKRGFNLYRRRWRIECLFADAKTRGLNIEDTHITDPNKLATLLIYRRPRRDMGLSMRYKNHGPQGYTTKNPWKARKIMVPHWI